MQLNKRAKTKFPRAKGFTLVELLVVIAIIAILAGIVTPNAFNAIEKAKVAKAEADYRAIKSAVLNYYADTGQWPSNLGTKDDSPSWKENIKHLTGPDPGVPGWNGPYLEKWPEKNPWGGWYLFVNWTGNDSPWGAPAKWIELSNVPGAGSNLTGAAKKLQEDLGTDIVKFDGSLTKILIWKSEQ